MSKWRAFLLDIGDSIGGVVIGMAMVKHDISSGLIGVGILVLSFVLKYQNDK